MNWESCPESSRTSSWKSKPWKRPGSVAGYTSVGLRMTKEAMWANLDATDLMSCLALENRNQDLAGQSEEVRAYMGRYRNTLGSKASSS